MRRLAPLLALLALTACATAPVPAETAAGLGGTGDENFPAVGPQSLEKWASFPVDADPRPLVVLGGAVNVRQGFAGENGKIMFSEGRIDANGMVPPEAAEAFAQLVKPDAAEPKLKVLSVEKGTATYQTDRGPRDLPAWSFQLSQTLGPVTVLAVKPDYEAQSFFTTARQSADGMSVTVSLAKAQEPCPGEPRVTYEPQWLESGTAVAVGLKKITGEVVPGQPGNCAHDLAYRTAEYTIKLDRPLGNRVLVDVSGNPIVVTA